MKKSKQLLREIWGFEEFRPGQELIVNDVINGHDVLAILPTGGGKSICFQVPGLAREGLTLVISPLIALMQDQVTNLQIKGIRAAALVSGMSYKQVDIILDNAKFGGIDFLYTSPERTLSTLFIERFKQMEIGLIVVDEAHCISEWGHDFRPSFRALKNLRTIHTDTPIIALTATATQLVQDDIVAQLNLRSPKFHISSLNRPNLYFESNESINKNQEILSFCRKHNKDQGILYCQTRKSVKELTALLHSQRFEVTMYHGGMSKEDRDLNLKSWLLEKKKIMVATNAFGMGIDKPNVRYVIHYEFPDSLEAYYQEAGRAGRDGKEAKALIFWEKEDVKELRERVAIRFPEMDFVKTCYFALCNFLQIAIGSGQNENYNFDFQLFCKNYNLNLQSTYHALKILESNNTITFNEDIAQSTKIKFIIGGTVLYNFQVSHPKLIPLIEILTRRFPGIFDYYFDIREKALAQDLKIDEKQLIAHLNLLEKYGVIDVSWKSNLPIITLIENRVPDNYFSISKESYTYRKNNARKKLNAAIAYLETRDCRTAFLSNYFDQHQKPCGNCDNCREKQNAIKESYAISEQILILLSDAKTLQELMEILKIDKESLKIELNKLLLDGHILYEDNVFKKMK
jgi:ATP-dependent DNA helicase RecQ